MQDNLPAEYKEDIESLMTSDKATSSFEDYDQVKVLILRRVEVSGDDLNFKPESFLLKASEVWRFDRDTKVLAPVAGGYEELFKTLDSYYRKSQRIVSGYLGQVEELEDYLFERNIPKVFMDIWFDLKKDLSRLENYYYRNQMIFHDFIKKSELWLGDGTEKFKGLQEEIKFQSANVESLKGRLDGVHNYYESVKADRLNKTLLSLTIISGIFLPLNLIVGFFGMNTPGLFFLADPEGTQKVVWVLAGVFLFFLLGFKVVRVIDNYVLRFLLGRYDFYRNLTVKLDEISDRLRGK